MNFLNIFKNKVICIPLLQRDYVQGGKESVISPFIDSLLDETNPSDLNYIYGYTEYGSFIPVDGQQRLTTLWLLYLYAAAKAGMMSDFTVNLTFLSREYAGDFCERLKCKMPEVLQKATKNDSLNSIIQDEYWFLSSWLNNTTVNNMLLTLKYIHRKCAGQEAETLWKHLLSEDGITFSFLDMSEENGLDDDIYIKMNGRGRPLSVFENLKSWMDEKVMQAMKDSNELWLHEWINNMDNSWTQFFWNNRNLTQINPEEIDDEQLFCFCNLIILYWMLNKEQLQSNIRGLRTTDHYLYEQLLTLFPQSKETDGTSEIVSYIFDKLQKGDMLSLVWIERLGLLPLDFLKFAHDSLNKLSCIYRAVNDLDLFMGNIDTNVMPIYDLALSESSYGRSLPLLYAVLLITEDIDTKAWMRECRNLILNTDIQKEKLPEILNCINAFAEQTKHSNVYTILQSYDKQENDFLHSFGSQIKEECKKASMPSEYFPQMEKMENSRFFSGRISSVFRMLEHEDGIESYTLQDFIDCSNILMEIFYAGDGRDGGVKSIYDKPDDRLLRRALMSFPPYFYGMYRNAYWCFCDNMEEWRLFLNNKDTEINSLRLLIIKTCLPALRHSSCADISESLLQSMHEAIDNANRDYEEKLEENEVDDKFNLHFIHHVGIWNYMGTSRCSWPEDDEHGLHILLKTSNGNNSGKMELRTYALYLDYLDTSIRKDLVDDRKGWSVGIWSREDTCMFFEIFVPQLKRNLAIDVFHKCKKEDDYALSVFLRPTNEEENDQNLYIENNYTFFKPFLDVNINIPIHQEEKSGRYITEKTFSRKGIQLLLHLLLPSLKEYITEHYGTESH